jgi:FkbM family methyltransferase
MSKLKLFFSDIINRFLKNFNLTIKRIRSHNQEIFESLLSVKNNLLIKQNNKLYFDFFNYLLSNIHLSSSQRFQDLFVDWMLKKKNGIFIEFGACDGIDISNTYYLEKYMGWTGILLEPAESWHNDIKINRPNCIIDFRCVSSQSGNEVDFYENSELKLSSSNSKSFSKNSYKVKTISLNDVFVEYKEKLLKNSNEPNSIDFISIDTEGNEYEILKNFDFNKYLPKIVIVEHNFDPIKSRQLKELFESHNYQNIFPELSAYDYFFVLKEVLLKKINEK